ncbi:H ACA ribonucleo complex non-core subunit NAF1 [Lecanosticta acicola]|uniref:H/ACA ribonucleoprotein complex non-core subunit NAF1 n=1 Tax=Lecanosticta acicola TaxID=111012 RepID=A0AAI9EBA0_9PEZI|nr:H ACA ribonucleo complex non-core subunit NAF1 [Lecanosticta acicola]
MSEHPNATVDLQNPDEARPPKRARLDAPLTVTQDLQQEVMDDDDDWDDVYGDTSANTDGGVAPVSDADPTSTLPSAPHEHQFGVTEDRPENGKQSEVPDGVPPEAISEGDDLVGPPPQPPLENNDKASIDVMEETTEAEVQPTVPALGKAAKTEERSEAEKSATNAQNGGLDQLMADVEPAQSRLKATEDAEFMQAAAAQKSNENAEWQFDTSDEDSSDSDTTDPDDSSDDSDSGSEGDYEMLDPATAAKILMAEEKNEEGEGAGANVDRQPRTQNEVKEEIVPKPDITITPEMPITFLGTVENIVEKMVLIKGATPGEYQVLEGGSVLCNEDRKVLGAVADTFGRVQEPMYSMAFTNAEEVRDYGLEIGSKIFYVNDHSTFVFTQPLRNLKGTDASNIHDEEVGEDELEFSDDEKEAEFKRQKKLAKKEGRGGLSRSAFESGERIVARPGFGGNSDAPAQTYGGGLSYDDNGSDDFYQPLKRPENLSQLMAGSAPPPREQPPFADRGRGRGRGDRGRGRGDRGRGDRGRGRGGFEQRHQRGGRGGFESGHQHQQGRGHRGNAHGLSDRQSGSGAQGAPQNQPNPPNAHQPASTQGLYQPPPQTYQTGSNQLSYGNQAAIAAQQYGYYGQQYNQQAPAGSVPAGAYVNPAFFHSQAQQQQQQAYTGWNGQYQHQQPAQPQAGSGAQQAPSNIDIGSILAQLQGQPPHQ